jgi:hypothetical protein
VRELRKSLDEHDIIWQLAQLSHVLLLLLCYRSDHIQQLRKSLDEHDVIWQLAPLFKIGDQPE